MSIKTPLSEMGRMYADSYEYPTDDAKLWLELFAKASERDRELYGRLLYIRGVGANLIPTGNKNMPYKIVPIIDVDKGWSCEAEYAREIQCLEKYKYMLVEVIRELC